MCVCVIFVCLASFEACNGALASITCGTMSLTFPFLSSSYTPPPSLSLSTIKAPFTENIAHYLLIALLLRLYTNDPHPIFFSHSHLLPRITHSHFLALVLFTTILRSASSPPPQKKKKKKNTHTQ